MTGGMVKVTSTSQMEIPMRANTRRERFGAKVNIYGRAASSMKASGSKAIRRAMVSGREWLVTTMSVNGEPTSHMGLASIRGATKTSTRENGKPASDTGKALTSLP